MSTTSANSRFVFGDLGHCVAFGFGAGLAPRAPGTWGTAVAIPLFALCDAAFLPAIVWALGFVFAAGGIWICGRTCRALNSRDDPGVVWDEIAAFYLVLCALPAWEHLPLAFAVFRILDIVKPPPIRQLDAATTGGWGVMADDLAAAAGTIAVVWAAKGLFSAGLF